MHAYLVTGDDYKEVQRKANEIIAEIGKECFEYSLTKISQVRELSNFLRLSISTPTVILIKDIENATEEALNAFLKMLEEPQENIKFLLTASSEYKIIPTISSRCQIIKIQNSKFKSQNFDIITKFLRMTIGEKFSFLEKIKDRTETADFIRDYIFYLHQFMRKKGIDLKDLSFLITLGEETLRKIKANGNIALNLNNFAIKTNQVEFTQWQI